MSPEMLAQRFHETYERLAPAFGYRTRRESAVAWEQVPQRNRALMIAVVKSLGLAQPNRGPYCECCDHSLEHAIRQVIDRYNAPIPPPSLRETIVNLGIALDAWKEHQVECASQEPR